MSNLISIRSGASLLPETSIVHLDHDIIYQSGVVNLYDNVNFVYDWVVTEHNPQNLSVDIAVGRGYFKKTTLTYHGYSTASNVVNITSNSSGNPRIDAVVAYVDLGATSDTTASNVLKFVVVAGTAAVSPTAPSDGDIGSSIGAGNPFLRLANIAVANGASAIEQFDISDARVACYMRMQGGIKDQDLVKPKVLASYQNVDFSNVSGTKALNCATYNVFWLTMTGNVTLSVADMVVGQYIQVDLIQDGTGSRVPTWFSTISWEDGVAPTQTATAGKRDSYVIKMTGTNTYIGYQIAQNI